MMEATTYIVENIEKSYEIYNSISEMQNTVLSGIDKAIKERYSDWLGKEWMVYEDCNLENDYYISVYHENLLLNDDNGEKEPYITIDFQLWGDDPIWKLFGIETDNKKDKVVTTLGLANLKILNNYNTKLLEEIDDLLKIELKQVGFTRKGGKNEPYYQTNIILSNKAIVKGLENDDWDEALKPIEDSWRILANLNWKKIIKTIEKYK
ncbi:MAG: hypothetical protein HQK70_04490 [Desulfamplus sp.]|nr:hypothetical protein [Desulfamplus sp.]